MSVFMKIVVGIATCIGAVIAFFKVGSKRGPAGQIDKTLSEKEFQIIEDLNSEILLSWVTNTLPSTFTSGKLRIFPQNRTVELMEGISLPKEQLEKCIYFDVVNEKGEVVLKKLVLPKHVGDEFACVLHGSMYNIPLEK